LREENKLSIKALALKIGHFFSTHCFFTFQIWRKEWEENHILGGEIDASFENMVREHKETSCWLINHQQAVSEYFPSK